MLLLLCDGELTNLSKNTLFLPLDIRAEIVINGDYAYPCTVRCEKDGGNAFGTELLSLEARRLVIYAEVPEGALMETPFALTLKIAAPDKSMNLRYDEME